MVRPRTELVCLTEASAQLDVELMSGGDTAVAASVHAGERAHQFLIGRRPFSSRWASSGRAANRRERRDVSATPATRGCSVSGRDIASATSALPPSARSANISTNSAQHVKLARRSARAVSERSTLSGASGDSGRRGPAPVLQEDMRQASRVADVAATPPRAAATSMIPSRVVILDSSSVWSHPLRPTELRFQDRRSQGVVNGLAEVSTFGEPCRRAAVKCRSHRGGHVQSTSQKLRKHLVVPKPARIALVSL